MAIATEAAELMEIFLWVESFKSSQFAQEKYQEVQDGIADIVILALCFVNATGIDLAKVVRKKFAKVKPKNIPSISNYFTRYIFIIRKKIFKGYILV